MALSICCITASPRRAAGALRGTRALADEIVVAVDVSAGEQDLAPLDAIADRVFEIELPGFPEPAMAWLHAQCSAEWILRVDDDELLSASLLEALPELTRARDVLQYWLARRWLYPDARRWLDEWPWFPDFQGRLVRNDPQLWFPGLCHTSIAPALPARYLDEGLYHLVHLLSDRGERERKVARYLQLDAALRETSADPHLARYYLPELRPHPRSALVDARDHAIIDAALSHASAVDAREHRSPPGASAVESREHRASSPPPGAVALAPRPRARPPARRVGAAELHARWAARELAESGYRATVAPVDLHRRLLAGDHRPFRVRVRNDGGEWWPGGEERRPLIRLAYRWLAPDGAVIDGEGHRTPLPQPLAAGESCVVAMNVTAPSRPGRYLLAPDLVHEHVRWFGSQSEPVEMLVADPRGARR